MSQPSTIPHAITIKLRPAEYGDTGLAYYQLRSGDLMPVFVVSWSRPYGIPYAKTDEGDEFAPSQIQFPIDVR